MWMFTVASAWAEGARAPVEPASIALGDARALVVRGVTGRVDLVGADVDAVSTAGSATSPVEVKLTRKDGVVYVRVKGDPAAALELTVTVPRSVAALTLHEQHGPMSVRGLETRFAVVSSDGALDAHGVDSLRVSHLSGAVTVDGVRTDVTVDALDGSLAVTGIGGDVDVTDVSGALNAEDVGGDLTVRGTAGAISQSGVRGTVHLP